MPGRTHRPDERGQSLSVFAAVVLVALFGIVGLVVDGGNQSAATRRCEQVAAQAARAAIDAGSDGRAAGGPADLGAMQRAGQRVVDASGLRGTVAIEAGQVRVATTTTTQTYFLSLLGIRTLTARGDAASLLRTPAAGG